MSGAGSAGTPGLSTNLQGGGHEMRYHAIEDARSINERLDASLVPPDRSLFEVAIHRSLGNWIFHVPATIAVLWLSTVIVDLALVTSAGEFQPINSNGSTVGFFDGPINQPSVSPTGTPADRDPAVRCPG